MSEEITSTKEHTDLTYMNMSKRAYQTLEEITHKKLKVQDLNKTTVNMNIQTTPKKKGQWQIIKALDDKRTDTQAYAFKKGDDIVIAYRGSKEIKDWVITDGDYLLFNPSSQPKDTRQRLTEGYKGYSIVGDSIKRPNDTNKKQQVRLTNAFDTSVDFAEKIKKEYPKATIDTTGHSLGGALATYVRVKARDDRNKPFVRQTTTFAAPNVYGMFPPDIQEEIDQGIYRNNTIDYTDARDTFGTLNDRFPQVGLQHIVKNGKVWLGNHQTVNFGHLFLADGEIRLTPDTIRELARKTDVLYSDIHNSYVEVDKFSGLHDEAMASIQYHFEGKIGTQYDRLDVADVQRIMHKLAKSMDGGKPKYYDTGTEEMLLQSLDELRKDARDIRENLNRMAHDFENKDKELGAWLSSGQ